MQHQWRTDEDGEVKPLDEDADHPVAQCRICGITSGCLHAQPDCPAIGAEPYLDADDCEGLDLAVVVTLSVRHPGNATEYRDRSGAEMRVEVSLADIVDHRADPVIEAMAKLVETMSGGWRAVRTQHESHWRQALGEQVMNEQERDG